MAIPILAIEMLPFVMDSIKPYVAVIWHRQQTGQPWRDSRLGAIRTLADIAGCGRDPAKSRAIGIVFDATLALAADLDNLQAHHILEQMRKRHLPAPKPPKPAKSQLPKRVREQPQREYRSDVPSLLDGDGNVIHNPQANMVD